MHVVIMRGLPGSGKSTYAKTLGGVIVSADDFFVDLFTRQWRFDPTKLGLAHQRCFRTFIRELQRKTPLVVVDNTNTRLWEASPYVLAAEAHGYVVELRKVVCPVDVAIQRNIHGVPAEIIEKMAAAWEDSLPWWNEQVIGA